MAPTTMKQEEFAGVRLEREGWALEQSSEPKHGSRSNGEVLRSVSDPPSFNVMHAERIFGETDIVLAVEP